MPLTSAFFLLQGGVTAIVMARERWRAPGYVLSAPGAFPDSRAHVPARICHLAVVVNAAAVAEQQQGRSRQLTWTGDNWDVCGNESADGSPSPSSLRFARPGLGSACQLGQSAKQGFLVLRESSSSEPALSFPPPLPLPSCLPLLGQPH